MPSFLDHQLIIRLIRTTKLFLAFTEPAEGKSEILKNLFSLDYDVWQHILLPWHFPWNFTTGGRRVGEG